MSSVALSGWATLGPNPKEKSQLCPGVRVEGQLCEEEKGELRTETVTTIASVLPKLIRALDMEPLWPMVTSPNVIAAVLVKNKEAGANPAPERTFVAEVLVTPLL